eukprot:5574809-Amphidinium_carterae.1
MPMNPTRMAQAFELRDWHKLAISRHANFVHYCLTSRDRKLHSHQKVSIVIVPLFAHHRTISY